MTHIYIYESNSFIYICVRHTYAVIGKLRKFADIPIYLVMKPLINST